LVFLIQILNKNEDTLERNSFISNSTEKGKQGLSRMAAEKKKKYYYSKKKEKKAEEVKKKK